jgi:two-component system, NarL family, response regulator
MPEIGVVLVDDHPIVLFGLMQLFVREPGIAVLAACTRGAEALAAVACRRPEVLLLDVSLPDRNGIEMLPEIAAVSPETRTVIFAATVEEERVVAALNAGAKAVVFKDTSASELVACIRQVGAGKWMMADAAGVPRGVADQRRHFNVAVRLSRREREIAERVARGARNKEIAWELGLAEGTVKLHISNAFKKLGIGNRVGLARMIAASPALRAEADTSHRSRTRAPALRSPSSNWNAGLLPANPEPVRRRAQRGGNEGNPD